MKLRIFAIITALLCFATLLVGCDNKEIPPCETHVDADSDAICDGCQRAVIHIIEELPYEEPIVEMVVKPIPTGKDLNQYVVSTPVNDSVFMEGNLVEVEKDADEALRVSDNERYYFWLEEEEDLAADPVTYVDTYTVWDKVTNQILWEKEVESNAYTYANRDTYLVNFANKFFEVRKNTYGNYGTPITEYSYYNYAQTGNLIANSARAIKNTKTADPSVTYLCFEELTVAVDPETYAVLYSCEPNTFVERPVFNYMTENYGVCKVEDKFLVYDLAVNPWINCVYAYTVPSAYENVSAWKMAGNKLLVQAYEPLLSSALNYDIEVSDAKYDIHYIVVDLTAKTATEQEFGYVISSVVVDAEFMTESAKTFVTAYEITDKKKDTNKVHHFVVDEKLDIAFDYAPLHLAQQGYALTPVGNGLFTTTFQFADGTTVEAVMDKNGFKNYMPRAYQESLGMLVIDGAYYTYTLNLVYDFKSAGFTLHANQADYVILKKVEATDVPGVTITKYFYYNGTGNIIELNEKAITLVTDYGFVTSKIEQKVVEGETVNETVYTLYNAKKAKIGEFRSSVTSIECVDEEGVFTIVTQNGTEYIVR